MDERGEATERVGELDGCIETKRGPVHGVDDASRSASVEGGDNGSDGDEPVIVILVAVTLDVLTVFPAN